MNTYIIGGDIGQSVDNTAIAVLKHKPFYKEKVGDPRSRMAQTKEMVSHSFDLVALEKIPLGTPYPKVVERFVHYTQHPKILNDYDMVVDTTGVGRAIYDYLIESGIPAVGVVTTGGQAVAWNQETQMWSLPKKDLVGALVMLYQTNRLKMNPSLPNLAQFKDQLQNFSAKMKKDTGHMSYEALSEEVHDDLVIAVALAGWWALICAGGIETVWKQAKREKGYDPKRFELQRRQ